LTTTTTLPDDFGSWIVFALVFEAVLNVLCSRWHAWRRRHRRRRSFPHPAGRRLHECNFTEAREKVVESARAARDRKVGSAVNARAHADFTNERGNRPCNALASSSPLPDVQLPTVPQDEPVVLPRRTLRDAEREFGL